MTAFLCLFLWIGFAIAQDRRHLLKGVLTNDSVHCNDVKEKLFHSTTEIDAQRLEFERFLPVYMKTQLFDLQTEKHVKGGENEKHVKDEKHTKGWDVEFPFTFEHPRFHVLGPIGPRCRTPIESYGSGDDEKRACGLQQLQKINQAVSENGKKPECVIYSIGSKGQWGFEESILAKTECRVETFDCTMAKDYQLPAHLKGRVRFHPICLADSDYEIDDRRYVSWTTLNKITGVATQPSFLKMDIEGYEYPVLKSIVDSGVFLPLQIAVEIHIIRVTNGKWDLRRANSLELYSFMNYLYKFGGYYLIDRHDNVLCKSCTEVVLAKLNCENFPRPDNYKEILMSSEDLQHAGFKNSLKDSLAAKYYG
eukprot:gene13999-15462_t